MVVYDLGDAIAMQFASTSELLIKSNPAEV